MELLSIKEQISDLVPVEVPDFKALLSAFVNQLDVKNSSRLTYRRSLRRYFQYIQERNLQLSNITRLDIIGYKEYLLNSGFSSLTAASYINAVRMFYEWAEANKYYPNVAKGVKAPKRIQTFKKMSLTGQQSTELLSYIQSTGSKRDYALINLAIRTGLRTIEISRANIEDIVYRATDEGIKRVLMVQGKGKDSKDDFVILTDKAYKPLEEYLQARKGKKVSEPIFISTSNNSKSERIGTRTISHIVKEGLKAIGINDRSYTAHSLRHTAATCILRAGGSLEQVQQTLRHSNPATTLIYVNTEKDNRRLVSGGEYLLDNIF